MEHHINLPPSVARFEQIFPGNVIYTDFKKEGCRQFTLDLSTPRPQMAMNLLKKEFRYLTMFDQFQ